MRVYTRPTGLHSRAMVRVADALEDYAPPSIEIVPDQKDADLVVSHVIGPDQPPDKPEIVIQYCFQTAGCDKETWLRRWEQAKLVWSYYDLPDIVSRNGFNFFYAPLGVDSVFAEDFKARQRSYVMTSGYVSGPAAEAIQEVTLAAWVLNMPHVHLGPEHVLGMSEKVTSIQGASDRQLAEYYRRSKWVSGLRHVEGFELPVVEGLCCGARPIVFDRPEMRQWFNGHAVFVPECDGHVLINHLLDVMGEEPEPVFEDERDWARSRFDWKSISESFWSRVL